MKIFDFGNGHTVKAEKSNRGIINEYKITFFEDGKKCDEEFWSKEDFEWEYDVIIAE